VTTPLNSSESSQLAAAYARGRVAREALLVAEGGVVSAEELGKLLGMTPSAVDERRRKGDLFAVHERGAWLYPTWQVSNGAVLDGLNDVLEVLAQGKFGPWDIMIFFLRTDTERDGESPLQALGTGRKDAAMRAARIYGEQGAR
jgi:hypothetical protein